MASVTSSHQQYAAQNAPQNTAGLQRRYDCGYELSGPDLSGQEIIERFADLQESTIHLQATHSAITSRMGVLRQDQEAATLANNDTFAKLADLLATTRGLSQSFEMFENRSFGTFQKELVAQKTEWLQAAKCQTKTHEEEVRRLLENFKSEVIAVSRESEVRHENHRLDMADLTDKWGKAVDSQVGLKDDFEKLLAAVEDISTKQQRFQADMSRKVEEMDRRLTSRVETVSDSAERNLREMERNYLSQEQSLALVEEKGKRYTEDCMTTMVNKVTKEITTEVNAVSDSLETAQEENQAKFRQIETTWLQGLQKESDVLQAQIQLGKDDVGALTTRLIDLRGSHENFTSQTARSFGTLEAEVTTNAKTVVDLSQKVHATSAATMENVQSEIRDLNQRIDAVDKQLTAVGSTVHVITTAQDRHDSTRQELLETVNVQLQEVREQTTAVATGDRDSFQQELLELEAKMNNRIDALTSTTHTALSGITMDKTNSAGLILQNQSKLAELAEAQQAIRDQVEAVSAAAAASPDSQSTAEIQDWVREVANLAATTTYVDDNVGRLQEEVRDMKDHTKTSVAALAQRLDAERAAREKDTKHVKDHVDRLFAAK